MSIETRSRRKVRGAWARLAWTGALACTLAFGAAAQDSPPPGGPGGGPGGPGGGGRGGGPQLSAEEREAAWTLQAKGVAAELGLSEDLAVKLAEAYITSRENLQSTMQDARAAGGGGGGGGGNRMEEFLKIQADERAILQADLATFLSAEQAAKAIVPLGTFNRQWDGYVNTLAKFGLDAEAQNKGLSHIAAFVVESSAVQAEAMAAGDFQSMRGKMTELKTKLDTAMGEILSEDQLNSWKASTAMRQGGGRQGGGNRPPGGGGGPGGPGGGPGGN